jgi:3-oxoacyl-[acyl-carrier-protein] synthase-1
VKQLAQAIAYGARTALGLDATSTALLLRTGVTAIGAAPLDDGDGGPVTMAFDPTLDPMAIGADRAARLATAAAEELVAKLPAGAIRALRIRVVLGLPETRGSQARRERNLLWSKELAVVLRTRFGDVEIEGDARGSAAVGYLLPSALAALTHRDVDAVIVGGVHSDYDPVEIATLRHEGRLFSPSDVDAVIPGESAAFVLLGRSDLDDRLGLPPGLAIRGMSTHAGDLDADGGGSAFDPSALAAVLRDLGNELPSELHIGWGLSDHGLEHYRTRELYAAITRTHTRFCEPLSIDSPPQRLGRTGAASLPLFLALAAEAYRRGYAPSPLGVLLAGSDGGERAGLLVGSV